MTTRRFYKMSGSGNDFVVFDAREQSAEALEDAVVIQALCARGTGVGADGVVFLEPPKGKEADFRMSYFNSDGSAADLCGNAALCVTRLAVDLGAGQREGMRFETRSGVLSARMAGAQPEVDMPSVTQVDPDAAIALSEGEHRIGFALAGVPHLVVLRDDVQGLDVVTRGRELRRHAAVKPRGANVNFVAKNASKEAAGQWLIRTYERGVEGETLACGTGTIASAILLGAWGESGLESTFATRSGREITVILRRDGDAWKPTLRGEGRLVFTGELGDR